MEMTTEQRAAMERVVETARKLVKVADEFFPDSPEALDEYLDVHIRALDRLGDEGPFDLSDPGAGEPDERWKRHFESSSYVATIEGVECWIDLPYDDTVGYRFHVFRNHPRWKARLTVSAVGNADTWEAAVYLAEKYAKEIARWCSGPTEAPSETLSEIKQRLAAAPAGPWGAVGNTVYFASDWWVAFPGAIPLANFIAHSRADMERLLTECEKLNASSAAALTTCTVSRADGSEE